LGLGEGADFKVGDDAQVSGATLEGVEEVGVGGVCGLDERAICEDNLDSLWSVHGHISAGTTDSHRRTRHRRKQVRVVQSRL
jgi:hypothetical protein